MLWKLSNTILILVALYIIDRVFIFMGKHYRTMLEVVPEGDEQVDSLNESEEETDSPENI